MAITETQIREKGSLYTREFRLDLYDSQTAEDRIRADIASYLGEYRFKIPEYAFSLLYTLGPDHRMRLRGQDGQSMVEVGMRAIRDRIERGGSTYKVAADLIGIQRQEALLEEAQDGDMIVYASPPDQKAGYTYGFFYLGEVRATKQGKILATRAIRLADHTSLKKCNDALSALSGEDIRFTTPNEFIAHPLLVKKGVQKEAVKHVLATHLQYDGTQQEKDHFLSCLAKLSHPIEEFIRLTKEGAPLMQREIAFNIIENYAQAMWQEKDSAPVRRGARPSHSTLLPQDMEKLFGHTPTQVSGTCPDVIKDKKSSDMFGIGSIFSGIPIGTSIELPEQTETWEYHRGDCILCKKKDKEVGPCNICKTCEKDKF